LTLESLSNSFYGANAQRYAQVANDFIQSVYSNASHLALTSDLDLMTWLKQLIPRGGMVWTPDAVLEPERSSTTGVTTMT
jgi:hypothetical protein